MTITIYQYIHVYIYIYTVNGWACLTQAYFRRKRLCGKKSNWQSVFWFLNIIMYCKLQTNIKFRKKIMFFSNESRTIKIRINGVGLNNFIYKISYFRTKSSVLFLRYDYRQSSFHLNITLNKKNKQTKNPKCCSICLMKH